MDKVWSQTEACYLSVPANMLWRVTAPLVCPGEGGDRTRGNKSCQLEPIIVLFELRSAAADSHRSAPRLSRVFWAGFP